MYRQLRVRSLKTPANAAVFLFARTTQLPSALQPVDRQAAGALQAFLGRREFKAEPGQVAWLYPRSSSSSATLDRLLVVGLGPADQFQNSTLIQAAASLLRAAWSAGISDLVLYWPPDMSEKLSPEALGRALGDGLSLGNFDFTDYKGAASKERNASPDRPLDLSLDVPRSLRPHVQRAFQIGRSVTLARQLAATPPNVANPAYLVRFARRLAREVGLRFRLISAAQARRLGMNALLAVGAAGSTPPAIIVLEWRARAASLRSARPVLLVGKAITFDTGGFSLKSPENMARMKYDKSGGCAVLATLHAAATLKLPLPLVGVIPTAENLISSSAYRLDDIVRACNGVSIEITNTDAEGRLILADALAWACRAYRPRAVIDLATLTGGIVVALGNYAAGLFCRHEPLTRRLLQAAEFTGEKLWPMPLWPEHREQLKSPHADIVNAAGREAHPIQGAAFLSYFVSADGRSDAFDNPPPEGWAHLDIAGMADAKKDTPLYPSGPTGFGIRLLIRTLECWS